MVVVRVVAEERVRRRLSRIYDGTSRRTRNGGGRRLVDFDFEQGLWTAGVHISTPGGALAVTHPYGHGRGCGCFRSVPGGTAGGCVVFG